MARSSLAEIIVTYNDFDKDLPGFSISGWSYHANVKRVPCKRVYEHVSTKIWRTKRVADRYAMHDGMLHNSLRTKLPNGGYGVYKKFLEARSATESQQSYEKPDVRSVVAAGRSPDANDMPYLTVKGKQEDTGSTRRDADIVRRLHSTQPSKTENLAKTICQISSCEPIEAPSEKLDTLSRLATASCQTLSRAPVAVEEKRVGGKKIFAFNPILTDERGTPTLDAAGFRWQFHQDLFLKGFAPEVRITVYADSQDRLLKEAMTNPRYKIPGSVLKCYSDVGPFQELTTKACHVTVKRMRILFFPWFGVGSGPFWQAAPKLVRSRGYNHSEWTTFWAKRLTHWAFDGKDPDIVVLHSDAWDLAAAWQNYYGGPEIFDNTSTKAEAKEFIMQRYGDYRWWHENPRFLDEWYRNARSMVANVRTLFPLTKVYWRHFSVTAPTANQRVAILRPSWVCGLLNQRSRALVEREGIGEIPWDLYTAGRASDAEWSSDGVHFAYHALYGYLNHLVNVAQCEVHNRTHINILYK
eukprot:1363738-Pyramimonas_sp.AAC.3